MNATILKLTFLHKFLKQYMIFHKVFGSLYTFQFYPQFEQDLMVVNWDWLMYQLLIIGFISFDSQCKLLKHQSYPSFCIQRVILNNDLQILHLQLPHKMSQTNHYLWFSLLLLRLRIKVLFVQMKHFENEVICLLFQITLLLKCLCCQTFQVS